MFPSDNTSPYYRFDLLDIELKLSLYDVGGPDQVWYMVVVSWFCFLILQHPLLFLFDELADY